MMYPDPVTLHTGARAGEKGTFPDTPMSLWEKPRTRPSCKAYGPSRCLSHLKEFLRSPIGLLVAGSLLFLADTSRGYISVCDTEIRYRIARQIWYHGSIRLPKDLKNPESYPLAVNRDGDLISFYGLGSSVLMLPGVILSDLASRFYPMATREEVSYMIGQFVYSAITLPIVGSLLLLGTYLLSIQIGIGARNALWAAFAGGFCTYLLVYTKTMGLELETTCILVWALVAYGKAPREPWRVIGASFLFGASLHFRYEMLIPVGITLSLFLIQSWRRDGWSWMFPCRLFGPAFAIGLLVLLHNYARTGDLMSGGYKEHLQALKVSLFGDYPGQFFIPAFFGGFKGYFWYNPIFFSYLVLLIPAWRKWNPIVLPAVLPLGAFLMFSTSLFWMVSEGGWGPRYIVIITPFLVLGFALLVDTDRMGRWMRSGLALFILASFAFQLTMSLEDHHRPYLQMREAERVLGDVDEGGGLGHFQGWGGSFLAGRLRDLGFPVGDSEDVRRAWMSSQVQSVPGGLSQNIWWLKVGSKFASGLIRSSLVVVGLLASLAGLVLMAAGLFPRKPEAAAPEPLQTT